MPEFEIKVPSEKVKKITEDTTSTSTKKNGKGKGKEKMTNDANDSASSGESKKQTAAPTQKEIGLELFEQHYISWHNQYLKPGVSKENKHYLLSDFEFHQDFHQLFRAHTDASLSVMSWQALLKEFHNICMYKSPVQHTYKRIALLDDTLIYDHCNAAHQVTIITAKGWNITDKSPVIFIRTPDMAEQCLPAEQGNIRELRPFLNFADTWEAMCIMAAILKGFIPTVPNPVIGIYGDQGSGKTLLLELIMQLVCPTYGSALMSLPTSDAALMSIATHNSCCAFDNVSGISDRQADMFCKISTGIRSDLKLSWLPPGIEFPAASSLVFLNGINNVFLRPDLADRSMSVYLRKITPSRRKSRESILQEFNAVKPRVLAGIFNGISSYLRNKEQVKLEAPPRLMDFAIMVTAAEEGLGWKKGAFMELYNSATMHAIADSLDSNPVAYAIINHMHDKHTPNPKELSAYGWVEELKTITEKNKFGGCIPSSPKALSQEIFRLKPQLERIGIQVDRIRTAMERAIRITVRNKPSRQEILKIDELEHIEEPGRDEEADMAEEALNAEITAREDKLARTVGRLEQNEDLPDNE